MFRCFPRGNLSGSHWSKFPGLHCRAAHTRFKTSALFALLFPQYIEFKFDYRGQPLPKGTFSACSKTAERVLGHDGETKLLAGCDREKSLFLRPLVLLALHTGLRRGEFLLLEWSRIDLDGRTIRIVNVTSNARNRIIPVNATAHTLLIDQLKKATSNLVFPSNRKPGQKLLDLKKGFKKAMELAGISHIRFHDVRHTFATSVAWAGVDTISVKHLPGHSKITMTARYAHSLADAKIAAVSMLDSASVCSSLDSNRTPAPVRLEPNSSPNGLAAQQ